MTVPEHFPDDPQEPNGRELTARADAAARVAEDRPLLERLWEQIKAGFHEGRHRA